MGKRTVITWQLDRPYLVDAILIVGENDAAFFLSEFYLYVGYDSDYSNNTLCPDGPFAYPIDSTYGTHQENNIAFGSEWPNGVESWCNLEGDHVSFVREPDAEIPMTEIRICNFGVIADPLIIIEEEVVQEAIETVSLFEELKQLFDA